MKSKVTLIVAPAEARERAAVRALIVEGLTERWGSYEPGFNPDLEDFDNFYGAAVTLVAKAERDIVGCGVLVKECDTVGRIVRMSVSKEHRHKGVGSEVLRALLEAAKAIGYRQIVLETTLTWQSAVAFYESHGFVPVAVKDGDQHFLLELNDAPSENMSSSSS
jgi:ribosomal protein S18 acetylase RimI-like enzyme